MVFVFIVFFKSKVNIFLGFKLIGGCVCVNELFLKKLFF